MQSKDDLEQQRKEYGRVNQKEYSKLVGTETLGSLAKARDESKRFGRVNVAGYNALTAKPPQRKATQRKRVAGK